MSRHNAGQLNYGAKFAEHGAAIGELRRAVNDITNKLDTIAVAIGDMKARTGPGIMDSAKLVGTSIFIFSMIVAGILFLARSVSSEDYHSLDKRLQRIELLAIK